jgi:hypothetical protein
MAMVAAGQLFFFWRKGWLAFLSGERTAEKIRQRGE